MGDLTKLQRLERMALLVNAPNPPQGVSGAIFAVVSGLRAYRAEVSRLLEARYQDGECDAVALHTLKMRVDDIEDCE